MRKHAKMITLYAALVVAVVGAWVGMDQLGVRPAFNGEVDAAEARVIERITDLGKFAGTTRILTLQNERRYYEQLLDDARLAHEANPSSALVNTMRDYVATLADIQHTITELRKLKERAP